jgi:hypothetical protein
MKTQVKCPWCGKDLGADEVKQRIYENNFGKVNERRCPECNGILAAYSVTEKLITDRVRTF